MLNEMYRGLCEAQTIFRVLVEMSVICWAKISEELLFLLCSSEAQQTQRDVKVDGEKCGQTA